VPGGSGDDRLFSSPSFAASPTSASASPRMRSTADTPRPARRNWRTVSRRTESRSPATSRMLRHGWDGPFKWSVHDVTRTREQLSDFVLRFLLNSRSAAWQMVPANQVATRCVQVLGRDEAAGLLRALDLPSVEDRVAALDVLRSLDDAGQLLVWMRALAGQIEEGLQFEEATLTDSRRQLIVSLQEVMGASSDAVTTHVIGRPRRSSASCSRRRLR
jgi:hypothetical protein